MKPKFIFSLSGFIIGMIVISMASVGLALFLTELQDEYSVEGNSSLSKYNISQELKDESENIRDATDIDQQEGWLDVIGGFFSSGFSALKVGGKSVDLFVGNDGLLDQATEDVEILQLFKDNIITIILIGIFVGVFLTVLVKWAL